MFVAIPKMNPPIEGVKARLVPYAPYHVEQYHKWMSQPHLLEQTASDQLNLDEEYANQISWTQSNDKYTWIVICKLDHRHRPKLGHRTSDEIQLNEISHMCGDVNLFMHEWLSPDQCEIEIMIAESSCQRNGLAVESCKLVMEFAKSFLNIKSFIAKIKQDNIASIKLFTEKLHFRIVEIIECFNEIECHSSECLCDQCQSTIT